MNRRVVALDVLRGLTVALMILVNNPGSWAHVPPFLRHAAWHGLTFADVVFPFFLFCVGVSMSLSFARRRVAGSGTSELLRKVVVRALIIFVFGLLLNGFPYGLPLGREQAAAFRPSDVTASLTSLRVMGVLQRIATCYLLAGVAVVLLRGNRGRWLFGASVVLVYELLMRLPLVDGWGGGSWALEDNFARWIDLLIIGPAHLYHTHGTPFDPEGLASSLTATVSVLLGHAAGEHLRRADAPAKAMRPLAAAGLVVALAGLILSPLEPLNKQLWTFSYVLVTGGLGAVVFAMCLWLIDVKGWRRRFEPAVVFGANPLVAFLGSGLLARLLAYARLPDGSGGEISPRRLLQLQDLIPVLGPQTASVLYALGNVLVWWAILRWLHRRGRHIRI